ncbi:MAG: ArsA family ATPase [Nitriliruptoraceae bacterium]|nr:ArsA family ATPase [Nitriliruptoraceae bacterium]
MLLFTGKGGVGKTSLASATAVQTAVAGARVLVTSTDAAHSLADAFDQPVGDRPTTISLGSSPVGGQLHAQQIDAQQRLERHWGQVRDYLSALLTWGGLGEVAAEELVLFPGLDELFALIDLEHQVASGRYDLVVVDCAPTAETLKLLALPDALRFYADRMLGPGRRLVRGVSSFALPRGPAGTPLPVPDDAVFDAVGDVHARLGAVHDLLTDTVRTSVRLVVNPERLVLAEAQRSATTLSLFGYGVDAVLVNRLLPPGDGDPFLTRWRATQQRHLAAAEAGFAPTPVLRAPLQADEPIGIEALDALGHALYGEVDPGGRLTEHQPVEVRETATGLELRVALPFTADDDLELHRRDGELHLKGAGGRRNRARPASLARADGGGAALDDGWLTIRFSAPVAAVRS